MLCSKCGKILRENAHFCMECGQTVPGARPIATSAKALPASEPKSRVVVWIVVLLVGGGIWWLASSDSADVQRLREKYFSPPHIESLSEKTFSIGPHGLASNKFTIPAGASNVSVTGHFETAGRPGDEIEALVLSDEAFVTWRNGYSTSSYYDSGKVLQGNIRATMPDDAGTYYLVFTNNVPGKSARTVQADVTLQYSRWAPDWFYRMKEAF